MSVLTRKRGVYRRPVIVLRPLGRRFIGTLTPVVTETYLATPRRTMTGVGA